jgi:oligopeptide/dipeptide ABC transporter ATP-binding protein
MTPRLEITGLVKRFELSRGGRVWQPRRVVHALESVDLTVGKGEFVALVGESGSGKTTLANCVAGFVQPTAGSVVLDGEPLVRVDESGHVHRGLSRKLLSRQVQMVFQDPSSALNARQTIGTALREPLTVHGVFDGAGARRRADELLELTGIPASYRDRYPHELNSGQRQRVVIARALALEPVLLLADEPVSRLDVSMQSQILNLLLDLHGSLGLTILFITHDLSVVRQVADRVVVLYLGRTMEVCSADAFFADPVHPYSEALVNATPRLEGGDISALPGEIPSPVAPPPGCPFTTRCPLAEPACEADVPPLRDVGAGRLVACIRRPAPVPAPAEISAR